MSIQTAYDAVIAERDIQDPGSEELPTLQSGLSPYGYTVLAEINTTSQRYTAPAAPDWESALDFLLGVMTGQEDRVQMQVERMRLVQRKADADAQSAEAAAEIERIDALPIRRQVDGASAGNR